MAPVRGAPGGKLVPFAQKLGGRVSGTGDTTSGITGATALPWALVLLAVGFGLGVLIARPEVPAAPPAAWTSYAEVYAAVAPVVLNVSVESPVQRVGSGFALSDEHVVTARHLVADADAVLVRTIDGVERRARVVGTDARTDLALLEVEGAELKPSTLGRSTDLAVGDTLLAIGNPYGLGHSLAVGVLGSRGRRIATDNGQARVEFLQLAAPLNPGNSGGPIFDQGGRVVGVLTGTHAQGQAIAFAVPVETLRAALPQLMAGARVSDAFLGVRTETAVEGVRVIQVVPTGPAGRAGIRPGDVITRLGSQPVRTPGELRALVEARPVKSYVFIRLIRDDAVLAIDVGLEDRAEQPVVVAGMILRPEPGTGGRVVALRPRSRAERAGLREGDLIRAVEGVPVLAPADVEELLGGGVSARLEVVRDGVPLTLGLAASTPDE